MSEEKDIKPTPATPAPKREVVEVDKKVLNEMMARLQVLEESDNKRKADETYNPYADQVEADVINLVAIEGEEKDDGTREELIVTGVKSGGKAFKKETDGGTIHNGLMTMILVRNSQGKEMEIAYDYNELAARAKIIPCILKERKNTPVIEDLGWITERKYVASPKLDGALVPQDGGEVRNLVKGVKTKFILTLPNGEDIEVYASAANIRY